MHLFPLAFVSGKRTITCCQCSTSAVSPPDWQYDIDGAPLRGVYCAKCASNPKEFPPIPYEGSTRGTKNPTAALGRTESDPDGSAAVSTL